MIQRRSLLIKNFISKQKTIHPFKHKYQSNHKVTQKFSYKICNTMLFRLCFISRLFKPVMFPMYHTYSSCVLSHSRPRFFLKNSSLTHMVNHNNNKITRVHFMCGDLDRFFFYFFKNRRFLFVVMRHTQIVFNNIYIFRVLFCLEPLNYL